MDLIESIYKQPDEWHLTYHHLVHKSGAKLWIANGMWFCEPAEHAYSIVDKWRAFRAYRWWVRNAPIERLKTRGSY